MTTTSSAQATDARRRQILEAAFSVFSRYGYRKASMEEVARLAQVSRQGLYLHFATKEDLFRASVRHCLERSLTAATEALEDAGRPLDQRLARAFDLWMGVRIDATGEEFDELVATARTLVGPLLAEHSATFRDRIAQAIVSEPDLLAAYQAIGIGATDLATTLVVAAKGLKFERAGREAFAAGMTTAARILCRPIL